MDLRTFFTLCDSLLISEKTLANLQNQAKQGDRELSELEDRLGELAKLIEKKASEIREEAKKEVAVYSAKKNYDSLREYLTINMSSFDSSMQPMLQTLLNNDVPAIDRATVLATLYPELFAKYLGADLGEKAPINGLIEEKDAMLKERAEKEKKLGELSSSLTEINKRIKNEEGRFDFPLKHVIEIVSMSELESWEKVLPRIKALKAKALEAEKAAPPQSQNSPNSENSENEMSASPDSMIIEDISANISY